MERVKNGFHIPRPSPAATLVPGGRSGRSRTLPSPHFLLTLLRHFGPGWLAFRAWYLFEARSGRLKRRMPAAGWRAYGLERILNRSVPADPAAYARCKIASLPPFFRIELASREKREIFGAWDRGGDSPLDQAAEIFSGTLRYFSVHKFKVGFPPDWHHNPFTGERLPEDRHWSEIPDFGGGDLKAVWEPSRFGFAFALLRAYGRSGEEIFPEAFWRLFEDWCRANPPNQGPNWKCGQEIALRVLAVASALCGFAASRTATPERLARMAGFMAASARRIEANIGYALSQQNNHGMSEAAGLWAVGALFPEFEGAGRWEARGRRLLERLGRELIYEDGAFCQHSAVYHRLMLQLYLWVLRLSEILEKPFSAELQRRVGRAALFLFQLVDEADGGAPLYGQSDGALILPLSNCAYGDFRPALQGLHIHFTGRRCFAPGPWDEDSLWLFGRRALEAEVRAPERCDLEAGAGGCATLRSPPGFAFVRCHRYRHRPGQADQLHMSIRWHGHDIAVDAGTFSYNASGAWANALDGSSCHNTVTVDDRDQMDRAGRFLWLPWAQATAGGRQPMASAGLKIWEGFHDGYRRLSDPVRHHRAAAVLGGGFWLVLDRLVCAGNHDYRLHWLLADWNYNWEPDKGRIRLHTPAGDYYLQLGAPVPFSQATLVRADPDSPRGWQAPGYLHREPALSVDLCARGETVWFWSVFGPQPSEIRCAGESLSVMNRAFAFEARLQEGAGPPLIASAELHRPS